jgi:hypothetical protein
MIYGYLHRDNLAVPSIVGKTVTHRVDGLRDIDGSWAERISAVDPKTGKVIKKHLEVTNITFYLDQPTEETQYATWKSNNLYDFDIEYHLEKNSMIPDYSLSSVAAVVFPKIMGCIVLGIIGLIIFTLIIAFICDVVLGKGGRV